MLPIQVQGRVKVWTFEEWKHEHYFSFQKQEHNGEVQTASRAETSAFHRQHNIHC